MKSFLKKSSNSVDHCRPFLKSISQSIRLDRVFFEKFKAEVNYLYVFNLPIIVYQPLYKNMGFESFKPIALFEAIFGEGLSCVVAKDGIYFVLENYVNNRIFVKTLNRLVKKIASYIKSKNIFFMYGINGSGEVYSDLESENVIKNNAMNNSGFNHCFLNIENVGVNQFNGLDNSGFDFVFFDNLNQSEKFNLLRFLFNLEKQIPFLNSIRSSIKKFNENADDPVVICNFQLSQIEVKKSQKQKNKWRIAFEFSFITLNLIFIFGVFFSSFVHHQLSEKIKFSIAHESDIFNLDKIFAQLNNFRSSWFNFYEFGILSQSQDRISLKIVDLIVKNYLPGIKLSLEEKIRANLFENREIELYETLKETLAHGINSANVQWANLYKKHVRPENHFVLELDKSLLQQARLRLEDWASSEEKMYLGFERKMLEKLESCKTFYAAQDRTRNLRSKVKLKKIYHYPFFKDHIVFGLDGWLNQLSSPAAVLNWMPNLKDKILFQYFQFYKRNWLLWIENLEANRFEGLQDAFLTLEAMTAPSGHLNQIKSEIQENLTPQEVQSHMSEKEKMTVKGILEDETSLKLLNDLKKHIDFLRFQENKSLESLNLLKELFSSSEKNSFIERLNDQKAVWMQGGLGHLYLTTVQNILNVLFREASLGLDQKWREEVLPVYETVKFQFPFKASSSEVTWEVLKTFFDPEGGVLKSFFDRYLCHFIHVRKNFLEKKVFFGQSMNFSQSYLNKMFHGLALGRSLGQDGGIHFSVYPKPDQRWCEISLNANGQRYRYRNEPEQYSRLSWNPQDNRFELRSGLKTRLTATNEVLEQNELGVWSFWKLLKGATFEMGVDHVAWMTWKIRTGPDTKSNRKVTLGLKFNAGDLPFIDLIRFGFDLPSHILTVF